MVENLKNVLDEGTHRQIIPVAIDSEDSDVQEDDIEEESDDGGVDSKLAVMSLRLIEVDADESTEMAYEDMMEVFARLDVAMAAAATRRWQRRRRPCGRH